MIGGLSCLDARDEAGFASGVVESHPVGPFEQALFRAFTDSFYQHLVDESWDVVKAVFERPEIAEARRKILMALAEEFARRGVGGNGSPPKP